MDNPLGTILCAVGALAVGAVTGFVGGMVYTTRKLAASEIEKLKDLATGTTAPPEMQADVMAQMRKLAEENGMDPDSVEGMTYGARKLLEGGGLTLDMFTAQEDEA
jgi:hypothetical protein